MLYMADGQVHCVEQGGWYPTIIDGKNKKNEIKNIVLETIMK